MEIKNTTLDDIASVVGYSVTQRIRTWFAGENLYIPVDPTDDSFLSRLLGLDIARRLSAEWPGEHIAVPLNLRARDPDYWRSQIWRFARDGMSTKDIAEQLVISERRVQQLVRELEQAGIIPPIGPGKTSRKMGV